ncbi:MAG: alanine/ornithine racemase family PLP-dependent enzyme [Candidatus Izemoplasmatales bacterium]|nr:alanine/ornithine racemase family PLP-dependent enzyme [Candidatus Izemoplasmatales bacterium]
MYPRVNINLKELKENCLKMISYSKTNGISKLMPVIKVVAGDLKIAKIFEECGFKYVGDSRIKNLKIYQDFHFKKMLVRLPSMSEIKDVILYSNLSLNSELVTVLALDLEAKRQNKKHEIIFMYDLGDLREGIYYKENYLEKIEKILKLENIILKGIGTNLTCYGGLVPSKSILNRLVKIKKDIENHFNIHLDIISGGNSSSVYLFDKQGIPSDINSLRVGEAIFFGKETAYSTSLPGFNHNIFTLEAEVIECQTKPSFPDGKMSINSFGEKVEIEDKGHMKRAILAIGKQDVLINNIFPVDNRVKIIGGSSDHLIVEVTNTRYSVGDIISFNLNYPGLLHLMNSPYVHRNYQ